jgi:hypothetical protein
LIYGVTAKNRRMNQEVVLQVNFWGVQEKFMGGLENYMDFERE